MGYAVYQLEVLASDDADAAWRQQRLQTWIKAWDGVPSLVEWFGYPMANATPMERYEAIGYMYYEDLESMFCSDAEDACRLTALVLGEALVTHFGFRWCRSNVFADEPLQVHHPDGHGTLHLPAMVTHALGHGHMDVLDELFCDVFIRWLRSYVPQHHWLLYLSCPDWTEEAHIRRFGVCPPRSLRWRIRLMAVKDEELLVRQLGADDFLPSRAITEEDDWRQLEMNIDALWHSFDELYGSGWSEPVMQAFQSLKELRA